MPKAASGLSALINGPHVPKCADCGAIDPDSRGHGYCQECGAIFGERLARRLKALQWISMMGTALCGVGGAAALWCRQEAFTWGGLAAVLVSAAVVGAAAVGLRRTAQSMQAAARMRGGNELIFYWSQADRRSLLLLGAFACVLVAMMPYVWFVHAPRFIRATTDAAFAGRLQQYVDLLPKDAVKPGGTPRRAFKLLVVDCDDDGPRVSPIHFLLPPEIRAATPDEVGTVALMRYRDVQAYRYEPGNQPAYERDGELTLIVLADKTVLEQRKFRGGPPPLKVPSGDAGYGPRPTHAVASYLKGLPSN